CPRMAVEPRAATMKVGISWMIGSLIVLLPAHHHPSLAARHVYRQEAPSQSGARAAERPRHRADERDELAALHDSMTSSARARSVGGTSRLSACAVIRFTTGSNLVGCSTGMSAGFAPRRILST